MLASPSQVGSYCMTGESWVVDGDWGELSGGWELAGDQIMEKNGAEKVKSPTCCGLRGIKHFETCS